MKVGLLEGYAKKKYISKVSTYNWNYIIINGLYFLLNINFVIGHYEDGKYINKTDEFFFLSSPRRFLFRLFPLNKKFQLVENPINLDEFCNTLFIP